VRQVSVINSGSSTASVSLEGIYVFTWTISNGVCPSSTADINVEFVPLPTASVTQPTCAVPSGSISVTTQSGVEYSLDGTTYQASNTFSGLLRMIIPYMFVLGYSCVTMSSSVITINAVPLPPAVPTASSTIQPTCAPSGTIVFRLKQGGY
jgi:hypothetical protein